MERTTKYELGDKVAYLDLHKNICTGTIESIKQTDIYKWNEDRGVEDLYLISHCPYFRLETEIIGLCEQRA